MELLDTLWLDEHFLRGLGYQLFFLSCTVWLDWEPFWHFQSEAALCLPLAGRWPSMRPDVALQALTVLKARGGMVIWGINCVQFLIFCDTWLFTKFCARPTSIVAEYETTNKVVILKIGGQVYLGKFIFIEIISFHLCTHS